MAQHNALNLLLNQVNWFQNAARSASAYPNGGYGLLVHQFQAVRDQYNGFKSTLTPQQLASSTNQLAELDAGLDIIQKAFTNLCDVSMARETGRVKLEWNNWNGQPGGAYGDISIMGTSREKCPNC